MEITFHLKSVNPNNDYQDTGERLKATLNVDATAINAQIEDEQACVHGEITLEVLSGVPTLYVWLAQDLGNDPTHKIELRPEE